MTNLGLVQLDIITTSLLLLLLGRVCLFVHPELPPKIISAYVSLSDKSICKIKMSNISVYAIANLRYLMIVLPVFFQLVRAPFLWAALVLPACLITITPLQADQHWSLGEGRIYATSLWDQDQSNRTQCILLPAPLSLNALTT